MINSKEIFKIRVDGKARLIFTYLHYQGLSALKIIDYIPDHDISGVNEIDHEKLHYVLWSTKNSVINSMVPILNKQQLTVVNNNDFPSMVFGAAGSGKTSISLEKYLSIYRELLGQGIEPKIQRLLYLTFNFRVAEEISSQMRIFFPKTFSMTIDNFFQEILKSNYIIQTGQDYTNWFDQKIKNAYDAKTRNYAFQIDSINPGNVSYTYYRGIYKGSPFDFENTSKPQPSISFDSFKEHLINESYTIESIQAMWDVFKKYDDYLESNKLYHDNDLSFKVLTNASHLFNKYENLIIDETQDLTLLQLYTLLKLSKYYKIHFFGDTNQTINPTIFSIGNLKSLVYKLTKGEKETSVAVLKKTYRASKRLVEYINHLVDVRRDWIGAQSEETDFHHETPGDDSDTRWAAKINDEELIIDSIKRTLSNPNAIVLTPSQQTKEDLLKRFSLEDDNQNRIYTIFEAKGLEWETVLLYRFIGDEIQKFIQMVEGRGKKSTIHRMTFNKYYVACTRARVSTIILDSFENDILKQTLLSPIHEIKSSNQLDFYLNNDTSSKAWFDEGVNLFRQFEYRKAYISFEKSFELEINQQSDSINQDTLVEYLDISKELDIVQKDRKKDLNGQFLEKLKAKSDYLIHLSNYYQNRNMMVQNKLISMHLGEQFNDDEISEIVMSTNLDSMDEKLLEENDYFKRMMKKKSDLLKDISEVLK
jgi:superfamily I DNA/RNA helicase